MKKIILVLISCLFLSANVPKRLLVTLTAYYTPEFEFSYVKTQKFKYSEEILIQKKWIKLYFKESFVSEETKREGFAFICNDYTRLLIEQKKKVLKQSKYKEAVDRLGNPLTEQTIAVDTNYIPKNSVVYYNGKRKYPTDSGSKIKGLKVDLYFNTNRDSAKKFKEKAFIYYY